MSRPRPTLPQLATTALVAAMPGLAACGVGGAGDPPSSVAEFALGADTPESREFVLTPMPGLRVPLLPAPSSAPPVTPAPDLAPAPDSAPQSPHESAFRPSVAWVNDGEYLAVVTFGSGSCPSGPHGVEVVADQEIEIRLGPLFADRDVCSADMGGHATVVELPDGIVPTKPLVARLGGHEVTIPAVSG